jgi:hypothetical protein
MDGRLRAPSRLYAALRVMGILKWWTGETHGTFGWERPQKEFLE